MMKIHNPHFKSTKLLFCFLVFFFSSRRRHTRWTGDWSSDVCSSDLDFFLEGVERREAGLDALAAPLAELDERYFALASRRMLRVEGVTLLVGPIRVEIGRASCRERV